MCSLSFSVRLPSPRIRCLVPPRVGHKPLDPRQKRGKGMGRAPCCDKANVKKGPWSAEEDAKLKEFIDKYGTGGNWIALPHKAGLNRCGKSCRLRWLNYLRPNIKHGEFTDDEDRIIFSLFAAIGSRWSIIANHLPGRTDNDIKNYWNTKLKKKVLGIPLSQRKSYRHQQHQQHFFLPSSFESTAVTSPSSQSTCYTAPRTLFTNFEGHPIPSDLLSTVSSATNSTLIQGPAAPRYQVKDSGSFLMFGGGEQSCSSSDGSCTQISYGKEIDFEYGGGGGGGEQLVFDNYLYGGLDDNQKPLICGVAAGSQEGRASNNGLWVDAPLAYNYEEIKQLLSSNPNTNPSSGSNNNSSSLLMVNPSSATRDSGLKAQGSVMYYL